MIDKLELLLALAQEKHFGRAAEVAGVTQPTLSTAVKSLEEQLGILIVERGSRFRGFTAEGERVLAWARKLVGDVRNMHQEVQALKAGVSGMLRLGVIPTALPFVPEITVPFRARYPHVSFSVQSLTSDQILARIENLELDAGITYVDMEPTRGVALLPLYEERYMVLVAPGSPLASLEAISWAEAGRLPLCLLTKDMQNRRIIERHLAECGGAREATLESNSLLLLYAHVRTGGWASILPARFVEAIDEPGRLKAIPLCEPSVSHCIGLVFEKREPNSPLVEALKALARRVAGQLATVPA